MRSSAMEARKVSMAEIRETALARSALGRKASQETSAAKEEDAAMEKDTTKSPKTKKA